MDDNLNLENLTFEGIASIEGRLQRKAESVGYIVLQDRTVPRKDETLGRIDLDPDAMSPYLDQILAQDEEDNENSWDAEPSEPTPATPAQMARAAMLWVREMAAQHTLGESFRRFRVKVWAPKAYRLVDSGQFVVRNPDAEEPADLVPEMPHHVPAVAAPEAEGMAALGSFYAQWGQIVLSSFGQLQQINNTLSTRLHTQLDQSREQVDQLVASILEHRFAQSQVQAADSAEQRQEQGRRILAQQALATVSEAAKVYLNAQNLTPEMTQLLSQLSASPALMEALKDPGVQALMQQPGQLEQVAAMLKMAASQAPSPVGTAAEQ